MLKTKLKKLKGEEMKPIEGIFHFEPTIGESFFVGNDFQTEPITEILDDEKFYVGEELYEWKISNADF